jgi:hypothetical protein
MDCIIHPIQKYIHNRRFPDLEIIKLTYSRLIMAGLMTREDALHDLENHPVDNCPEEILNLFLRNVGMTKMQFDNYIDLGPRHLNYHPQPSVGLKIAKKLLSMKDAGNY